MCIVETTFSAALLTLRKFMSDYPEKRTIIRWHMAYVDLNRSMKLFVLYSIPCIAILVVNYVQTCVQEVTKSGKFSELPHGFPASKHNNFSLLNVEAVSRTFFRAQTYDVLTSAQGDGDHLDVFALGGVIRSVQIVHDEKGLVLSVLG
jgi:hypothetical protein